MKYNLQIFLLTICLASSFSYSKNYIGIQSNYMTKNNRLKFKGIDLIGESKKRRLPGNSYNIDKGLNINNNLLTYSVLCGWQSNKNIIGYLFVEAEYSYHPSKKRKLGIDIYDDGLSLTARHSLDNENITIALKQTFSFMMGLDIPLTKNFMEVIGIKLNATEYKVNASHTSKKTKLIREDNSKTKKTYIFSIEPMLGIKYKLNPNVSIRILAGYMIGNNKKIIKNYIGEPNLLNKKGINCGVSLQPKSFNLKIGVIYTF